MSIWKSDWPAAQRALVDWWEGKGLALQVTAPRDEPWEDVPAPPATDDLRVRWLDPVHRAQVEIHRMSRTFYGGAAFPSFSVDVGGPGSLGLFLGCEGRLAPDTVWYEPSMSDPERHPPLRPDPENEWWRLHLAAIDEGLRHAPGRYLVGMPDLIENLDTYAQLRGPQQTLYDLVERPETVIGRIAEINDAYFTCFDALRDLIADPMGGQSFHAFSIWGPGRVAKLQCDISCAISPTMFRRVVLPALEEQCAWLDYSLYHLDGTQAIPQLDNLLGIEDLDAIEWTPQAGIPGGGSPEWYNLYRRIKAGGKGVQAIGVAPDEVLPLIDAVGPEGLFIMTWASSEAQARALLDRVGWDESAGREAAHNG